MRWCYLGQVGYDRALELQLRLRASILDRRIDDTVLFLEHPPVITMGRSAREENVLIRPEQRRQRGVELVRTGRGGDVTYHGPGQLVGYPIRRVGRGVREHVRGMVDALRATLLELGIESWWNEDQPGVWTESGKIAAVGVDATTGVAIHGFALNVNPSLEHFQMIVPCGLRAPVTSVEALLGSEATPDLLTISARLAPELAARYKTTCEAFSPGELEGMA
jgi:lipoyl(octanoyl) transferase